MAISSASAGPRTSAPAPGGEAEVGGDEPHTADMPQPADVRRDQGEAQRGQQPFRRHTARQAERAPDVLMVDQSLGQPDPAAERRMQPPGLQVPCQQLQQLLRAAPVIPGQCGGVDQAGPEPAPDRNSRKLARAQLVIADHVRHYVTHPPSRAQRRRLPPLWRQCREERREIRPLLARQAAHIHTGQASHPLLTW